MAFLERYRFQPWSHNMPQVPRYIEMFKRIAIALATVAALGSVANAKQVKFDGDIAHVMALGLLKYCPSQWEAEWGVDGEERYNGRMKFYKDAVESDTRSLDVAFDYIESTIGYDRHALCERAADFFKNYK